MRPDYCLIILHVPILAALFLTLGADSEDSECEVESRVRRNTVYEGFLGKDLRINCTIGFCNNSPPEVSWYKMEKTAVLLSVSSNSRIKTEWKSFNSSVGTSYLIFQNTLINDSGVYRCRSGGTVSHSINVTVRGENSECNIVIAVHRNTVYEAFLGEGLRINCAVQFCNNSPPAVSWYKLEKTVVPVNVSSHIKMQWKSLNHFEGRSFLVFKNILRSDSGVYQCQSGDAVGHAINVTVYGDDENTTSEPQCPAIQDHVWHVYRAAGILAFLIIVVTVICVTSKSGCKGARCAGHRRDTPDMSLEPSHHALPPIHIYENDQ